MRSGKRCEEGTSKDFFTYLHTHKFGTTFQRQPRDNGDFSSSLVNVTGSPEKDWEGE